MCCMDIFFYVFAAGSVGIDFGWRPQGPRECVAFEMDITVYFSSRQEPSASISDGAQLKDRLIERVCCICD